MLIMVFINSLKNFFIIITLFLKKAFHYIKLKQMKIVLFNEKLTLLQQLFEECLKSRATLKKIPNNQFLKTIIVQLDTQKRGFISKEKLLNVLLQKNNRCQKDQLFIQKYLNQLFPFQKISYTVLIGHLLKIRQQEQEWQKQTEINFLQNSQNSQKVSNLTTSCKNFNNTTMIISKILRNQSLISSIKDQILPQIQKFIPFCQQNLTSEQFSEYLRSQSLNLNPQKILKCLNGLTGRGSSKYLQYKFFKQDQEQIQNQSFSNELEMEFSQIKQITERLSNRVQNFGSSWLK